MGVLDTLAAASPAQRTVPIYLDGEGQAEADVIAATFQAALDEDLEAAKRDSMENEPTTPALDAAIARHEAIRNRIAASEVTFHFQAMPWADRVSLQAAHPPRPGNLADMSRQYNFETYLPALIRASVTKIVGADGDTTTSDQVPTATWEGLLGAPAVTREDATETQPARDAVRASLNAAQMNLLVNAALGVNETSQGVPPSALSSRATQDSGESSTPSGPGESAPDASTAGSRPTSPTSSDGPKPTTKKAPAKKRSSGKSAGS